MIKNDRLIGWKFNKRYILDTAGDNKVSRANLPREAPFQPYMGRGERNLLHATKIAYEILLSTLRGTIFRDFVYLYMYFQMEDNTVEVKYSKK